MTNARRLALVMQRNELVERIAIERVVIARNSASVWRLSLMIDMVRDGIRYVRSHPEALLLPVAIVLVSRPRRLLSFAVSAVGFWRMARIWRRRILS
jgi:hypothetical protein